MPVYYSLLIYKVLPEVAEVVWIRRKTENFCWVMPATNHVNLGFNYGAELPDPKSILEGPGKLFRHYKVKSVEDLNNPDLIGILKYATAITYAARHKSEMK